MTPIQISQTLVNVRAIKRRPRSVLFITADELTQSDLEQLSDQISEALPDQPTVVSNFEIRHPPTFMTIPEVQSLIAHLLDAIREKYTVENKATP